MTDVMTVFDRRLVRRHRERASAGIEGHDFLFREVGERLADRLADIRRNFSTALDLGCHDGTLGRLLAGRGGIEMLVRCDLSPAMAARAAAGGPSLAADEELLPFGPGTLDLVLSNLSLHWVNDLPGTLVQIRQALKPDGLLLAALLGGETLRELRAALTEAEIAERGGASPRISPFAGLRDAAGLLQRAGFALPVADIDTITVTYPDALALMRDLRGMGEANATLARDRRPIVRNLVARAAALYQQRHGSVDGRVPATFQVLFLAGWAPHATQQQPLRRGTARHRLADALDAPPEDLPQESQGNLRD
jgi:NADH dehydrogenase [ubiquinone] 1 alpha subcomplex assembly factor 5